MSRCIVLLTRATPGLRDGDDLRALAEAVQRRIGDPTRVAYLDGAHPGLTDVLSEDFAEFVLVPAQVPADRYLTSWARRVVAAWLSRAADPPSVRLAGEWVRDESTAAAVAAAVDGPVTELTTAAAPLLSPAWAEVPAFTRHALVCRGPRCLALGSAAAEKALRARLDEHEITDDGVMVTPTGCLFPCALGPVVAVYPDDVWYGDLDPPLAVRIAEEHLVHGRIVDDAVVRGPSV